MIFLINLVLIIGILLLGYRRYRSNRLKAYFWPGALAKLIAGILVGLFYKFYYPGGDTYAYFEAAIALSDVAFVSWDSFVDIFFLSNYEALPGFIYTWIPSAFFVKVLAVLALLTNGNYWLAGAYLSLFSFYGLWIWTLSLHRLLNNRSIAVLSGLLFPSILFWSSGIMKESLAVPALAVLGALFIRLYLDIKINRYYILSAVVLFIVLALTKYFLAAIFLAVILSIFITRRVLPGEGKWFYEIVSLVSVFLIIGGITSLFHPNLWPSRIAEVIFSNYQGYFQHSTSGNLMVYPTFSPDFFSMLFNLPKAIIVGLFIPLFPIDGSVISALAVVENWLLVLGSLMLIIYIPLPQSRNRRLLLWGSLLFVLVAAGLIALSTPNLGTLSRYKTGYLLIYAPLVVSGLFKLYEKIVHKG